MAGLFDFNYQDPSEVGKMAFGAGLLNAAGPSRMPVSTGQALAQAMMARQQAASEAGQNQRRNALVQAQIEEMRARTEELQRGKQQQKFLSLGGGSYLDTTTGQVHRAPEAPKIEETPSAIRSLIAAGIDPKSPQGQQIIRDNLVRPFAPPAPANHVFMPTGPTGEIVGFNPRNPSQPVPTGFTGQPKSAGANQGFRDTQSLRKEFEGRQEVKSYREALPVYNSIANTPETPAGDLNYIYGVGKILDPNSVVREGEMKLVIQSGSPLQRILGTTSWVFGQNRLTAGQRAELAALMGQRMGSLQQQYQGAATEFSDLASRSGFKPEDVILNRQAVPQAPPGATPVSAPAGGGWTPEKESKYQELLKKRGAANGP